MKKLLAILFLTLGLSIGYFCNAQYSVLYNFTGGTSSEFPYGSLTLSGHKLYGMTCYGGANNLGCVFSMDTDGTVYTDLLDFNGTNGAYPAYSSLTLSGKVLYGMTSNGGANDSGCIFSIDTNGLRYKDLFDFSGIPDGKWPYGSLIVSKNKLYGMTAYGGHLEYGSIFSLDTGGGGYKNIYTFSGSDGANPNGALTLSGKVLYGMTFNGGLFGAGVIFSIDTDGSFFNPLVSFTGTNTSPQGSNPDGNLTLSGNILYGMTETGGATSNGNIFSYNIATTAFTDLLDFSGANGSLPFGSLTLYGKKLFGMTNQGGANFLGNIFSIDTTGASYKDLVDLNGSSTPLGANPNGLLLRSGNLLYGMTYDGGVNSDGVVFKYTLINITTTDTNITCNGSNNGHAFVYAQGGATPYTYSWTNGSTQAKATGLSSGSYTVTVTDNNGFTATASISISQPTALAITMNSNTNELCNGESVASATANAATGGTTPYTYSWAPSGGTNLTATGLSAGTYTITVTDNQDCTATASVNITQPAAIAITKHSLASSSITACNGSAWVTVIGGTGPYTYSWSGGQTTDSIFNQCHGNYCCKVTDAHGCKDSTCINIVVTGIDNMASGPAQINIYPNPNNGAFTIAGLTNGQIVELYNYMGQKVSTCIAENTSMHFDISTKAEGVYLIKIVNKDGSVAMEKKIVKTQ